MIEELKERIRDYEKEMVIKNQEVCDVKLENLSEEQKNTAQENIV